KLWDGDANHVSLLLTIEETLKMVDEILKPLLDHYDTDFGGSYIELKNELIMVPTLDPEMIEKIRFSPHIIDYRNYLLFEPAIKSLRQLRYEWYHIKQLVIDHRKNTKSILSILIYTDEKANNNVVVISNDDGSNERLKDAIKHYNPIIIYKATQPHDSSISKPRRQSKVGIRMNLIIANFEADKGDSGAAIFSFSRPQDLRLVNLIGINTGGFKLASLHDGSDQLTTNLPIEFILNNDKIPITLVTQPI
ncbi:32178_t:CDS:2, partial [Racocetra persica]